MEKYSGGSIGLGTILFIVFLVLKLTSVINWSWLWVTSPLWIPFALCIVLLLIYTIITVFETKKQLKQ